MIFTETELDTPMQPFFGHAGDWMNWQSTIFSPDLDGISLWDSSLATAMHQAGTNANTMLGTWPDGTPITQGVSFVSRVSFHNMVTVVRQTMGRVATTAGILSRKLRQVRGVMEPSATAVAQRLDVVTAQVNALEDVMVAAWNTAMDTIGVLPVVGWVINAVVRLAEFVIGVIRKVQNKGDAEARRFLAEQAGIPISATEYSREADTAQGKIFFQAIADGNAQYIVTPRYGARPLRAYGSADEWRTQWRGLKQWAGDGESLQAREYAWAWIVKAQDAGLGFVPGTTNIHGALWYPTRYCSDIRDLGDLYPSARVGAYNWWNQLLDSPTAMFTVNADKAINDWIAYMEAAYEFVDLEIRKGWTCEATSAPFKEQFLCTIDVAPRGPNCRRNNKGDDVRGKDKDEWRSIQGQGHYSVAWNYLSNLFFRSAGPARRDPSRPVALDNIDWEQSVPVVALRNLQARQKVTLDSYDCMYVDDTARFRAIGNDSQLRTQWRANVQKVFDAGAWRNVRFEDLPPGEVRDNVLQACANAGINCETLDGSPQARLSGPVFQEEPLPPPPPPSEVDTTPVFKVRPMGGRKRGGGLGIALGIGAAAVLLGGKR